MSTEPSVSENTVENALKGQFPGIKTFDQYMIEDMEEILDKINAKSVSAVSCVANNKAHENASNQVLCTGIGKTGPVHAGRKIYGYYYCKWYFSGTIKGTAERL